MLTRIQQLDHEGIDLILAAGKTWLEERVRLWPSSWGDDLHVFLYGDFRPPDSELSYPSLGITVHPENKREGSIMQGARTVLEAIVEVDEKSVDALIDAARRINLLLGSYTLWEWGNAGCGWWSWVTHGTGGGVLTKIQHDGIEHSITAILKLQHAVRRKVESALFWVREPHNLLLECYRTDILRVFSSYWNAFECLVDAVAILNPPPTPTKKEKQKEIDDFFRVQKALFGNRRKRPTVKNIQDCYL